MRLLVTTVPGTSHVLPVVPLAQAAVAAGHDVLVASGGPGTTTAVAAGLPTVALDDGESHRLYEDMARRVSTTSITRDWSDAELVEYFASVFAEIGAVVVERLVDVGRGWGADAVLYLPPAVAGPVAARALGVPAVLHGIGTRRPTFGPALARLMPRAEKLGVSDVGAPEAEIDLSPGSLETIHQDRPDASPARRTLRMRYVPYTGGAVLPDWLLATPSRRRVAVTLGSIPLIYRDGGLLRWIVEACAGRDLELVVTTGGADVPALEGHESVPGVDVRVVAWMPMRALLASCSAIVHHGGMGTMYAAFDAGVPQLAIPTDGTDSTANARVLAARGAGIHLAGARADPATISEALDRLLDDPDLVQAGREVRSEMHAMPTPHRVVDELAEVLACDS